MSSLSVFGGGSNEVGELEPLPPLAAVHGGYSQSKWVSERLLALSAARGVPVTLYRPARITGHSESGACNTEDFLFRMLKGCVQLRAYPAFNWLERAAPIDFVAAATVAISMRPHCARHLAFCRSELQTP